MRYLTALLATVFCAALAYATNLPHLLGAHPWWSQSVILIGLPIGVILAGIFARTGVGHLTQLLITTGLAGLSFGIATWGKARFAASYAEDVLAGQMWYVGWIATCALTAAFIASLMWPRRHTR